MRTPELDRISKEIDGMTDFTQYIRMLLQNGIFALSSTDTVDEQPQDKERRWVGTIGIWTASILKRREETGLSNDPLLVNIILGHVPHSLFEEFIIDEKTTRIVHKGLVLGLGITGVIDPSEIIQPTPKVTVASYFGLKR